MHATTDNKRLDRYPARVRHERPRAALPGFNVDYHAVTRFPRPSGTARRAPWSAARDGDIALPRDHNAAHVDRGELWRKFRIPAASTSSVTTPRSRRSFHPSASP